MSPRPQIEHIRKPQILAAAGEVIAERGISGTRISDVAERAGTSSATVLYWFPSKDVLLAEALIADEHRFDEEMSSRLARLDRPSRRLLELLEACANEYDWTLWIELWTRALRDPSVRAARERLDDNWRAMLSRIVAAGARSGEFAPGDADRAAHTLAALIDGLAVQVTLGDGTVPQERMLELCITAANSLLDVDLQAAVAPRGDADGDDAMSRVGETTGAGLLSRRQLLRAGAGAALGAYGLAGLAGCGIGRGIRGTSTESSSRRWTATSSTSTTRSTSTRRS